MEMKKQNFPLTAAWGVQIRHQVKNIHRGKCSTGTRCPGRLWTWRFSKPGSSGLILVIALFQAEDRTRSLLTNSSAILWVCNLTLLKEGIWCQTDCQHYGDLNPSSRLSLECPDFINMPNFHWSKERLWSCFLIKYEFLEWH